MRTAVQLNVHVFLVAGFNLSCHHMVRMAFSCPKLLDIYDCVDDDMANSDTRPVMVDCTDDNISHTYGSISSVAAASACYGLYGCGCMTKQFWISLVSTNIEMLLRISKDPVTKGITPSQIRKNGYISLMANAVKILRVPMFLHIATRVLVHRWYAQTQKL